MAKLAWTIKYGATDITSKVMSMYITDGREKYLDPYPGGTLTLTINNASNYASTMTYGSQIDVYTGTKFSQYTQKFWVQEITYQDYPGDTGLNTAIITAVDALGYLGRIYANGTSLTQTGTGNQAYQFNTSAGGPVPSSILTGSQYSGNSIASSTTYNGTVLNRINLLVQTERSVIFQSYSSPDNSPVGVTVRQRDNIALIPLNQITLGRTTSTTQIAYQSFMRIQNGASFSNIATISPETVAAQTFTNTTSVATYGSAYYTASTVDATTTQASGNASWVANTFSDPASLRFEIQFMDVAQNSTALTTFMEKSFANAQPYYTLSYTAPGGASTSVNVYAEGWNANVTPDQTTFTMFFSPLTYYQFFVLNSSTLGILNTSRLGW